MDPPTNNSRKERLPADIALKISGSGSAQRYFYQTWLDQEKDWGKVLVYEKTREITSKHEEKNRNG